MKHLTKEFAFTPDLNKIPASFQPLAAFPLIIIVGLTGVGKSTVVELLQKELDFTLLPNRRTVADAVIIDSLQQADGEPAYPITDRGLRFKYTARYRARYPGGMAHALSRLAVQSTRVQPLLVFDGLRGLDEIQYATSYFPKARFVVLDAPDITRLSRLLNRGDAFDTVRVDTVHVETTGQNDNLIATLNAIANIDVAFSKEKLAQIANTARTQRWATDDVVKKVSIIVKERHNYDSQAALKYLTGTRLPQQLLVVDTANFTPANVAAQVKAWLVGKQD